MPPSRPPGAAALPSLFPKHGGPHRGDKEPRAEIATLRQGIRVAAEVPEKKTAVAATKK